MRYMVTFIDDSPGISRFSKKFNTFSKFKKFRDITEGEAERMFAFYKHTTKESIHYMSSPSILKTIRYTINLLVLVHNNRRA